MKQLVSILISLIINNIRPLGDDFPIKRL